MVDREKFDHALAMRQQLEAHYPDRNFQDAFQLSEELRDHFEIKLLVVGHFSAGKSALLNALLQRPAFLKEAQQPQTALATELVYDTTEQAFAYRKDGSCEELQAGKEYLPEEYSHLEYHVNAPALARIADYTIVDTPGFDSGIEAHAQALSNYIGVGSAYLVVVDQEKGGLDETTLQFIREISHYSDQIAVVLNKCDKITPDTVEQIVSAVEQSCAPCCPACSGRRTRRRCGSFWRGTRRRRRWLSAIWVTCPSCGDWVGRCGATSG